MPSKTDPIRLPYGVVVYAPKPGAARQQHRIVWRTRDGQRRSSWRAHRDDALAAAQEIVEALEAVAGGRDVENRARPFRDLTRIYLRYGQELDWSESHAVNQQSVVNHWLDRHLGDTPCIAFERDPGLLRTPFDRARQAGRKESTIRLIHVTLGAVCRLGVERGFFLADPSQRIRAVTRRGLRRQGQSGVYVGPHEIPDRDAVEALADAWATLEGPERGLEVRLAAYSGLRWGEQHELRVADVDLTNGALLIERQVLHPGGYRHVHLPKYEKVRTTFVPAFLDGALRAHLGERKGADEPAAAPCPPACRRGVETGSGPLVFDRGDGEWIDPKVFRRRFRKACEKAGWPRTRDGGWRWSWHGLRHHFCTWALAAPPDGLGLEVADVTWYAGHHSPSFTFQAYVSTRPGAIDRARRASGSEHFTSGSSIRGLE